MSTQKSINFNILRGKIITQILENSHDRISFKTSDGTIYLLWHDQDCCENVSIIKTDGNISDLIGAEIIEATEIISNEIPIGLTDSSYCDESNTWTTFILVSAHGHRVVIIWHGSSNGYYSESVSFDQTSI